MKTLIVLPARDEERNIGAVLDCIAELYPELPVLVVNDASRDSTARVVETRPWIMLINLPFWMGYGGALQTAYKYALQEGYDGVVQLDADGQHDPASIRELIGGLEKADVVVGSRFLGGTTRYTMSLVRRFGCYMLSWTTQLLTGMRITDPTSGFQALGRKALRVAVQDHYPLDYPDVDVLILMNRYKLTVIEIPVVMHPSIEKHGMHQGLAVWYYGLKMMLSMFVMMLRRA